MIRTPPIRLPVARLRAAARDIVLRRVAERIGRTDDPLPRGADLASAAPSLGQILTKT